MEYVKVSLENGKYRNGESKDFSISIIGLDELTKAMNRIAESLERSK